MAAKPNLNQTHLKPIFDYLDVLCEQEIKSLDTMVLINNLQAESDLRKTKVDVFIDKLNCELDKIKLIYANIPEEYREYIHAVVTSFSLKSNSVDLQALGIMNSYSYKYLFLSTDEIKDMCAKQFEAINNIRDFYSKLKGNIVLTDDLSKIRELLLNAGIDITLISGGVINNTVSKRATSKNDMCPTCGDNLENCSCGDADDAESEATSSQLSGTLQNYQTGEIIAQVSDIKMSETSETNPVLGLPNTRPKFVLK